MKTLRKSIIPHHTAMWFGIALPLLFLGIFFLIPVLNMVRIGFFQNDSGTLAYMAEVFSRPRTLRVLGQTVLQASIATAISALIGTPLAWVLYRRKFVGVAVLRVLIFVPFVLPTVIVGIAFRSAFQPQGIFGFLNLDGSFWAIIAALVFFNVSVVVRTVGGAWQNLDPRPEEAAKTLGAKPAQVFWTITLKRLAPSLWSAVSIVFLFCATAFGVVLTMGGLKYGTVETEIYLLTVQFLDLPAASVLSIIQFIVIGVALYISTAAKNRNSFSQREVSAQKAVPRLAKHFRLLPLAVWALAAFMLLPILNMVWRSFNNDDGFTLEHYAALGHLPSGFQSTVFEALTNSIELGLTAATLAIVLGTITALSLNRLTKRHRKFASVIDNMIMLPLGVSSVTLGLGFLITLNHPPFDLRTSPILIPIAQALVALPFVIRLVLPFLNRISDRVRETARVLGASPFQVLRDIDLRLALRPVAAAYVFAFAIALGEFGATLFLARPDKPTLPVIIYRLISRPGVESFSMAIAASVILVSIIVLFTVLVEKIQKGASGVF